MSISDDIRKRCNLCGGIIDSDDKTELRDLVDRIDTETVGLPKSADGKIWTGREACFWTGATEEDWHEFDGLHYTKGRWCVEDNDRDRYLAASVWYERPDSWERIADELDDFSDANYASGLLKQGIKDFADRIRKLAEKEKK